MPTTRRSFNDTYTGENLNYPAFPLGGIGAGMVCLEGRGTLSHVSVRHTPEVYNEPLMLGALHIKGRGGTTRVLEGPVPSWKIRFPWKHGMNGSGNGQGGHTYGLPRFANARFLARFPFGTVTLTDPAVPLTAEITGWSPFVPGDSHNSSLPVAALEYTFSNPTNRTVNAVFSYHARNFMSCAEKGRGAVVKATSGGFILWQEGTQEAPWHRGGFSIAVDEPAAKVDCAWFRGGWFDSITMLWKAVSHGRLVANRPVRKGPPSPGGSVYVPLRIKPKGTRTVVLRFAWHVPQSNLRVGEAAEKGDEHLPAYYSPWYAARYPTLRKIESYWRRKYHDLRTESVRFSNCFYDTTLPPEVVEAVAANLSILKSPTILRQSDGRIWAWEGCCDCSGCCHGSCTHVWNYAQALPHLFPDLERTLRQTEFGENQDRRGHQAFRALLPIRRQKHGWYAAADGQLGGIMKVYREWRISGDGEWLRGMWPKVKKSLNYCIRTWDPRHRGVLEEPHHNTYDIEFWGADGMCSSFYLGALRASMLMGEALGDSVPLYQRLYQEGRRRLESELFNGSYFFQRVQCKGLDSPDPVTCSRKSIRGGYSPEARRLLREEGPKYQYGTGCLSDGVVGDWMAEACGIGAILDKRKVDRHLRSVYAHNFRHDLSDHANPQRSSYALGTEGGLLLCSWPKGNEPSLPFPYSNEVWTGIEYQVASHLMMHGRIKEGTEIVRTARARYDGRVRNPFNEYECGHWYARALSSYALLQGMAGIRYDHVDKKLYVHPKVKGDVRAFLATAGGFGTAAVKNGKPFLEVKHGAIDVNTIDYVPAPG